MDMIPESIKVKIEVDTTQLDEAIEKAKTLQLISKEDCDVLNKWVKGLFDEYVNEMLSAELVERKTQR